MSGVIISALIYEGLSAANESGTPLQFAVVDNEGQVVEAGRHVADAAWRAAVNAYREFLIGNGHLRVLTRPETLANDEFD